MVCNGSKQQWSGNSGSSLYVRSRWGFGPIPEYKYEEEWMDHPAPAPNAMSLLHLLYDTLCSVHPTALRIVVLSVKGSLAQEQVCSLLLGCGRPVTSRHTRQVGW